MEFTDILNDMFLELPGCPEAMQKQSLRLAFREFCVKSEGFILELSPIDVEDGVTDYNLITGCNCSIIRIKTVRYGTEATDSNTTPLDPDQYGLANEWTLTLKNEPTTDITDGLVVSVALRPKYNQDPDLPEWFLERWGDFICMGAKSRLMMMTGKPWSNKADGQDYRVEFYNGIQNASRERFSDMKTQDLMFESIGGEFAI